MERFSGGKRKERPFCFSRPQNSCSPISRSNGSFYSEWGSCRWSLFVLFCSRVATNPYRRYFFLMEAPVDRGHSLIYIGSGSLDAWNNAVLRDSGSK